MKVFSGAAFLDFAVLNCVTSQVEIPLATSSDSEIGRCHSQIICPKYFRKIINKLVLLIPIVISLSKKCVCIGGVAGLGMGFFHFRKTIVNTEKWIGKPQTDQKALFC